MMTVCVLNCSNVALAWTRNPEVMVWCTGCGSMLLGVEGGAGVCVTGKHGILGGGDGLACEHEAFSVSRLLI